MRRIAAVIVVLAATASCGGDDKATSTTSTAPTATEAPAPPTSGSEVPTTAPSGPVELALSEVARNLDTVWSLAFDPAGKLWFTQRGGELRQLGGPSRSIPGVVEQGEGGLMGLEIDPRGRLYLMFTSGSDNRVVRLDSLDAQPQVLVDGLRKAAIHNGGRLRFGPDGKLYAGTGDSANTSLPQNDANLNGKILQIDPDGGATVFSKGHRNPQGLCFEPSGRFLSTEHGPDRGDEINVITGGGNGGWPDEVGNGLKNYTPTIALAGCAVYSADTIPQWKGSMLFVTLKGEDLRRLTFAADGSVAGEEILYDGQFGRLRDVTVGPDGAVYLATSNKDTRGNPGDGDDRIYKIAPKR